MPCTRAYLSVICPCLPVIPWLKVIVLAASRILLRRHRRTFHLLRQREAHSLEDPSRGYTYTACRPTNFTKPSREFQLFRVFPCEVGAIVLLISTPAPFTRGAAAPACVLGPALWRYAQELGRRLDGHRQPSRQSRAFNHACDRQRRCALPLALRTRGTPFAEHTHTVLMHRHSPPLQLPDDTTVVPRATARAARRVVTRA